MRKPILNNFLGCISLNTAGRIVGWLSIIGGTLGLFGSVIIAILAALALGSGTLTDTETTAMIVAIVIFSILAIYLVVLIIVAVFLLNGIKRRDHGKVMGMVVILAIGAVLDLISIFNSPTVGSVITNIIVAAIAVYIFLVILSLYQKIQMENEQGGTVNHPSGIVYNPPQIGQNVANVPQNSNVGWKN